MDKIDVLLDGDYTHEQWETLNDEYEKLTWQAEQILPAIDAVKEVGHFGGVIYYAKEDTSIVLAQQHSDGFHKMGFRRNMFRLGNVTPFIRDIEDFFS